MRKIFQKIQRDLEKCQVHGTVNNDLGHVTIPAPLFFTILGVARHLGRPVEGEEK